MNEINKLRTKPTRPFDGGQPAEISSQLACVLQQQSGYSFGNDIHTIYGAPARTCNRCPRRMTCAENRLNPEVSVTPSGYSRSTSSIPIN